MTFSNNVSLGLCVSTCRLTVEIEALNPRATRQTHRSRNHQNVADVFRPKTTTSLFSLTPPGSTTY